ncbi:MAG: serine/threonine-protein kinase [Planctomycetes bacterium]|nr:serine/threonine-protein kinase [Planctomycetota bacterium]
MQAELLVEAGAEAGRRLAVAEGQRVVTGRAEDAGLPLRDEACSRHHAAFALGPGGLTVADLGSKNGTRVNGAPLAPEAPAPLRPGDVVELGGHRIRVVGLRVVSAQAAPRVRDEFERLSELGRGGFGTVFAARHRASGRLVAIKALVQRLDASAAARFQREARVRVDSPHVVQVIDVRVEEGQVYLVMELVQGRSLDAALRAGPMDVPAALRVGEQLALALSAAHRAGVVHRDVKPANVLLDEAGQVKLADFGVAKVAGETTLTASGTGMGTLTYVAPEQATDAKHVSPAADIYALGATVYHAVAGRPPFLPGPDLVRQLFEEDPPPLHRLRPECPPDVAALVHRLLEKEPDDRPSSAAQVAERLRERRLRHYPGM